MGQSQMYNLERLPTQGTQDEEKHNKNTEKLTTQGTQHEGNQNKNTGTQDK